MLFALADNGQVFKPFKELANCILSEAESQIGEAQRLLIHNSNYFNLTCSGVYRELGKFNNTFLKYQ